MKVKSGISEKNCGMNKTFVVHFMFRIMNTCTSDIILYVLIVAFCIIYTLISVTSAEFEMVAVHATRTCQVDY